LAPHKLIMLAPHRKGTAPQETREKSFETCCTSSEIADRKYDIFHITVFELGMLACPLTK